MTTKTLLLVPAAVALCVAQPASAYVGFRLNLAVPLFYASPGYYYPPSGYARTVVYAAPRGVEGEQVTVAPGPGYVWMAGHWTNVSQRWVWVAGHWEQPPSPSAVYVGGHWAQGGGGWVWVDGTWSVGGAPAQAGAPPQPPSGPPDAIAQAPVNEATPMPPSSAVIPAPSTPAPPEPEISDGTVVESEPPAAIAEYVPTAPYPDYVWLGGYWGWSGAWVWHAGHFAPRPFRGAAWVSGGWSRGGRGWAWHGGRWR
jgi:WXXGXW repeat (2 copies)